MNTIRAACVRPSASCWAPVLRNLAAPPAPPPKPPESIDGEYRGTSTRFQADSRACPHPGLVRFDVSDNAFQYRWDPGHLGRCDDRARWHDHRRRGTHHAGRQADRAEDRGRRHQRQLRTAFHGDQGAVVACLHALRLHPRPGADPRLRRRAAGRPRRGRRAVRSGILAALLAGRLAGDARPAVPRAGRARDPAVRRRRDPVRDARNAVPRRLCRLRAIRRSCR